MRRRWMGLLLLLTGGCIGPGGWDGYADGAPYDPATSGHVWTGNGQPGVVDLRSDARFGIYTSVK